MRRMRRLHESNGIKFAIVFWVVNLHTLRNLSIIGYLCVYVPVTVYIVAQYFAKNRRALLADRGYLFDLWVLVGFVGFTVSLLIISPTGAATGIIRFLFAAPIFMAFVLYTSDAHDLRSHIRTMVFFFVFAGLTVPLQFLTGPIAWFDDASSRAGLERYSSLVGSLTSIGVIVGCYLLLVQMLPAASRYILLAIIALPALLSLSKSAVLNVAFGVVLVLYLNRRSLSKVVAIVSVFLIGGYIVAHEVPTVVERISASLSSFGVDESGRGIVNYDTSASSSAWDRVTSLPLANISALGELHSPLVYAVGGGFGMGNTALVPEADSLAPMAHNQFAESFSMFGAIGSAVQLFIMAAIALRLFRRYRATTEQLYLVTLCAYGLFLLNSVFANGTIYQPAGASILWLSLFVATTKVFQKKAPNLSSQVSNSRLDRTLRSGSGTTPRSWRSGGAPLANHPLGGPGSPT